MTVATLVAIAAFSGWVLTLLAWVKLHALASQMAELRKDLVETNDVATTARDDSQANHLAYTRLDSRQSSLRQYAHLLSDRVARIEDADKVEWEGPES